jgi:hypothetical protein
MMVSLSDTQTQTQPLHPTLYQQPQPQQPMQRPMQQNHIRNEGEIHGKNDQPQEDILPLPPFTPGETLDGGCLNLIEVIGHGTSFLNKSIGDLEN